MSVEANLEWTEPVNCMKAFMEDNLHNPITAADVARSARYSQYHATRVFKAVTGVPPFDYLRRQRSLAAARSLRTSEQNMLSSALDFMFDSQAGFTRAFANGFGISPRQLANRSEPVGWLVP